MYFDIASSMASKFLAASSPICLSPRVLLYTGGASFRFVGAPAAGAAGPLTDILPALPLALLVPHGFALLPPRPTPHAISSAGLEGNDDDANNEVYTEDPIAVVDEFNGTAGYEEEAVFPSGAIACECHEDLIAPFLFSWAAAASGPPQGDDGGALFVFRRSFARLGPAFGTGIM